MSSLVLQCPLCDQPFQVLPVQQGHAVQCPSCSQVVMVPKHVAPPPTETVPTPQSNEQTVFGCPVCSGQFGITAEMFGQQVGCPHCTSLVLIQDPPQIAESQTKKPGTHDPEIELPPPQPVQPSLEIEFQANEDIRQPNVGDSLDKPSTVTQLVSEPNQKTAQPDNIPAGKTPAHDSMVATNIEHLLPPRFDVIDPDQLAFRQYSGGEHHVILPDGMGGLKKVDDRIHKVKHGDQEINLISLSTEQLRRRRQIQNAVFMIGGAIILAIIFALLRKSV